MQLFVDALAHKGWQVGVGPVDVARSTELRVDTQTTNMLLTTAQEPKLV